MIPKRWIEAYLRFLLRNRLAVSVVVALMTVFFAAELRYIKVVPQFLDFYPGPSHTERIQLAASSIGIGSAVQVTPPSVLFSTVPALPTIQPFCPRTKTS